MAKVLGGRQAVPLEEVVLPQAFQLEALLNVLDRKGVITKAKVLEEIKQLRAKSVTAPRTTTSAEVSPRRSPPRGRTCYFLVAFSGPGCLAMTRSLIVS